MKCDSCENYIVKLDTCKFCHYEEKNDKICNNCKYFVDSIFGDCELNMDMDYDVIGNRVYYGRCEKWEKKDE